MTVGPRGILLGISRGPTGAHKGCYAGAHEFSRGSPRRIRLQDNYCSVNKPLRAVGYARGTGKVDGKTKFVLLIL